jgi:hypothetical protein
VPKAVTDDVRRLIDRGLARYGRGELREAIDEWQAALELDGVNEEARTLIEYVSQKMAAVEDNSHSDHRITEPVMPTFSEFVPAKEDTERSHTDLPAVGDPIFPDESVDERPHHATVESPIPQLLAQMTDPGYTPPPERDPAAPQETLFEDTRRLGSDSYYASGRVPAAAMHPTTDDASEMRLRASELVDRCRGQLERGNLEAAAAAAEAALREGERAPHPGIPEVIGPARSLFETAFEALVGPPQGIPVPAMSSAALAGQDFDSRAGFLLSHMDGELTVDGLLDVAGMPRFEVFRILAALLRAKAIRFV